MRLDLDRETDKLRHYKNAAKGNPKERAQKTAKFASGLATCTDVPTAPARIGAIMLQDNRMTRRVFIAGVYVTAVKPNSGSQRGFYVQNDSLGPYSGIFVFTAQGASGALVLGTHFAGSSAGHVVADGPGWRWSP